MLQINTCQLTSERNRTAQYGYVGYGLRRISIFTFLYNTVKTAFFLTTQHFPTRIWSRSQLILLYQSSSDSLSYKKMSETNLHLKPDYLRVIIFIVVVTIISLASFYGNRYIASHVVQDPLFSKSCLSKTSAISPDALNFYRPQCIIPWVERDLPLIKKEFQYIFETDETGLDFSAHRHHGGTETLAEQSDVQKANHKLQQEEIMNKKSILVVESRIPFFHHFPHFSELYTYYFSILLWQQDVFASRSKSSKLSTYHNSPENTFIKTLSIKEDGYKFWTIDAKSHSWMSALVSTVERHFGIKTIQSTSCDGKVNLHARHLTTTNSINNEHNNNDNNEYADKDKHHHRQLVGDNSTDQHIHNSNLNHIQKYSNSISSEDMMTTIHNNLFHNSADANQTHRSDTNSNIVDHSSNSHAHSAIHSSSNNSNNSDKNNNSVNMTNIHNNLFHNTAVFDSGSNSNNNQIANTVKTVTTTVTKYHAWFMHPTDSYLLTHQILGTDPCELHNKRNELLHNNVNILLLNRKDDRKLMNKKDVMHNIVNTVKINDKNIVQFDFTTTATATDSSVTSAITSTTRYLRRQLDSISSMLSLGKTTNVRLYSSIIDKYFDSLSFKQQVAVMYQTDVLIAVHGAGETNMAWMKPCSVVIEIFPSHFYAPRCFEEMTDTKDLLYYSIQSDTHNTIHTNNYAANPECHKVINDMDKFEKQYSINNSNSSSNSNSNNVVKTKYANTVIIQPSHKNTLVNRNTNNKNTNNNNNINTQYSDYTSRHLINNMEVNNKCLNNGVCRSCSRGADGVNVDIPKLKALLTTALKDREICIANNLLYSPK